MPQKHFSVIASASVAGALSFHPRGLSLMIEEHLPSLAIVPPMGAAGTGQCRVPKKREAN